LCASGAIRFPTYDINKLGNLELGLDHSVNITTDIAFGKNCETDAKISYKATLGQTEEQKRFESEREDPEAPKRGNIYAQYYQDCKNSKFVWNKFPYCQRYLYHITQLRNSVGDITYENIPPRFANLTKKYLRLVNTFRYPYLDIDYGYNLNEANRVHFETNTSVSPFGQGVKVDSRLFTPYFNAFYTGVPYPGFIPVHTFPLFGYRYRESLMKRRKYPFCAVQGKVVQTFDNYTYVQPDIGSCSQIVARDCSAEHNFAILSSNVDANKKYNRALTVYILHKFKIELVPSADDSKLIVKLNGKELPVTESEPYFQNIKMGEKTKEIFSISYNGAYYTIDAEKFGFFVHTEGSGIYVQVSRYYWGKVCGICGDLNGETIHELRGSCGTVYKTTDHFVNSYLIPSGTCKPTLPTESGSNEL